MTYDNTCLISLFTLSVALTSNSYISPPVISQMYLEVSLRHQNFVFFTFFIFITLWSKVSSNKTEYFRKSNLKTTCYKKHQTNLWFFHYILCRLPSLSSYPVSLFSQNPSFFGRFLDAEGKKQSTAFLKMRRKSQRRALNIAPSPLLESQTLPLNRRL